MTTGDIHWVELPPVGGHEQTGRRPALILSSNRIFTILDRLIGRAPSPIA
jgi:mRNA-degrading endonuclease toxin of MazEF toxin-antitoxin module